MPEYAGYVSPEKSVNWSAAFGGLAQKISDVGTNIKKQREALDAIKVENENLVDSYVPGKNPMIDEVVIRGAGDARSQIKKWNDQLKSGDLSAEDYKTNNANLKQTWGMLSNAAKNYDERINQTMSRQEADENGKVLGSSFELELLRQYSKMTDISEMSVQVGSDGRVYMAKKDENGNIIGEPFDVKSMSLPDNMISNRIDVASSTESLTKNWDPWTVWEDAGKGGELTISDVRENPIFDKMKAQVAETIAPNSNPRAQITVLADNGVLNPIYYANEGEYKEKKQEAIDEAIQLKRTAGLPNPEELTPEELNDIEFNMVKTEMDQRGIINPVPTEEQQKAAKNRVMQEVEIQLGRKVSGTPKHDYGSGSGGGGTRGKEVDTALWDTLGNAWMQGDLSTLNSYLKNKTSYKVKKGPDKEYTLYKTTKDDLTGEVKEVEEMSSADLTDFIPYYYGTGAAAQKTALKQRDAWRAQRNSGKSTASNSGGGKKFN